MLLAMLGGLLSVVALTITFFLTDRSRWRKVLCVIGIIGIALSSFQAYRSQERAAALQTKLNARTLTKQQFDDLQQLKGRVSKINVIYETAVEPSLFASEIITAWCMQELT